MASGIKPISGFPEWLPQEKVVEEDFQARTQENVSVFG
jgi:hypothetical protein